MLNKLAFSYFPSLFLETLSTLSLWGGGGGPAGQNDLEIYLKEGLRVI